MVARRLIQQLGTIERKREAFHLLNQRLALALLQVINLHDRSFAGNRTGEALHWGGGIVDVALSSSKAANDTGFRRQGDDAVLNAVKVDAKLGRLFFLFSVGLSRFFAFFLILALRVRS